MRRRLAALGTALLLLVSLGAGALLLRARWADAVDGSPRAAVPVALGTWKPMGVGSPGHDVTADVRVVRLERHATLTDQGLGGGGGGGGTTVRPPAGASYVVAVLQCRCPSSADLLAPDTLVVDDRGRSWDAASGLYGDYAELQGYAKAFDLGDPKDAPSVDGVVTWADVFEVPTDATGLGAFTDRYEGNWLYR